MSRIHPDAVRDFPPDADPPMERDWQADCSDSMPDKMTTAPTARERALEQELEQTRDLIRHAPTAIAHIEFATESFVDVNEAACAMTGHSREQLMAMNPFDLLEEGSRALFRERIRMSVAGRPASDQLEYRINRIDQADMYVLLDVRLLYDTNGQALGAFIIGRDITARKQAEEALRKSRRRLRSVLENVGDTVSVFDLEKGGFSLVSRPHSSDSGSTPQEQVDASLDQLLGRVHPDDRDIVRAQHEMLLSGVGGSSLVEYRCRIASGEYRWFNSRRTLVRDEEGRPVSIVGVSRDITERKRREAGAAFMTALASVFQSISEEEILAEVAERVRGHIEADAVCAQELRSGESIRAFWSPQGQHEPAVVAALPALIDDDTNHGVVVRETLPLPLADGSGTVSCACIVVPHCRAGDCTQLFAAICRKPRVWRQDEIDIVQQVAQRLFPRLERARAEEALRRSEEMYRKIVTTASEGLWLTDMDGTITFVNKIMADWLGYDIAEMLGRRPSDFTLHESLADSYQEWDTQTDWNCGRYDFKLRRKDGSAIWLIASGTPLEGSSGARVGSLTMFMDISERKQAEQSLAFHARLLECVHDAICAMDPHDRIIYWNDMAESMFGWTADEAIGQKSSELLGAVVPGSMLECAERVTVRDAYCSGEIACRHRDGHEIQTSVNATVVRGEDQEVTQIVASFRDVTERKLAADALERSHLVLETELMRTTVLRELASTVASSLDLRELSVRALRIAKERMGCDTGCIYLLDEDAGPARAIAHFGYESRDPRLEAVNVESSTLTGRAMASGRIQVRTGSEMLEGTALLADMDGEDPHRLIAVPVQVRGAVIGVLDLSSPGSGEFTRDEMELYQAVAQQLSVGFENARLYETEHRIAETLQETLVMLPNRVPGVTFSRAYMSAAAESGRVGGDFFDIFEIQRSHVGIVIGDVSGKGIDAAVITSLIRNTVRAHAIDGLSPGDVCAKTNVVVNRFTEVESYATMFFGVLNTRSGLLRYVIAGHPPALVVHADGECEEIFGKNLIIGAFERGEFSEKQTLMRSGDRLVLYTDGVTEARAPSARHFYDLDGLKLSVRENARVQTSRLAKVLMHDVVRYSEGVLRDDAAILVVQATRLRCDDRPDTPQLDFG
ncbi:MAG: hypothetical protein CVT60_02110 [Actinobacteria bacterium HGW-Actinobacteria-10]|nr:MAG: hypothetical protein CVT60_02110 [Actinobacteria bacterium HGW-Actinobacteria-10]